MTIQEAAKRLSELLESSFGEGKFSVGHDEKSTIYVYEHVRGFAKRRMRPDWLSDEFRLIYRYVGKIRLC